MLSVKKRQKYLKALGFYSGKIDGRWNKACKEATLRLQKKYFKREKDRDGVYGNDTDILLRTVYYFRDINNFKPADFRCTCGHCTGYPVVISRQLLLNLQHLRDRYGPIIITSGLRCKWKNSSLSGSSSTSRHMRGKAADFYNAKLTSTKTKRNTMVKKWYTYKKANYSYANTPGMGNAVHVDVK